MMPKLLPIVVILVLAAGGASYLMQGRTDEPVEMAQAPEAQTAAPDTVAGDAARLADDAADAAQTAAETADEAPATEATDS
ncbi:hypothetical protein GBO37_08490, partial [Paracoccus sp. 08]|nr:hypothetical protein [Paracoccus sp. 08]